MYNMKCARVTEDVFLRLCSNLVRLLTNDWSLEKYNLLSFLLRAFLFILYFPPNIHIYASHTLHSNSPHFPRYAYMPNHTQVYGVVRVVGYHHHHIKGGGRWACASLISLHMHTISVISHLRITCTCDYIHLL